MTQTTNLPTKLDWDSEFFGFPIGRLPSVNLNSASVNAADEWASTHQIRCMYCLVDSTANTAIKILERNNYNFADMRLTFSTPVMTPPAITQRNKYATAAVKPHREADIARLEEIAEHTFDNTRFFFDTNFPIQKARDLYRLWVKKGCLASNTEVLVYYDENKPLGFITCTANTNRIGSIGLIGVAAEAQRKGVGKALTYSALQWFHHQELEKVEVVTQGSNIGAQRLYQLFGFKTQSLQLWYHKWY